MSRIGRKPVEIPKGVEIMISGRDISVKGPKGKLAWQHPERIGVTVEGAQAIVSRNSNLKQHRAYHGLTRSLLQNMVTGVTSGYTKVLEIQGVGYRAQVQGGKISFALGYSHPIEMVLPSGIAAEVDKKQTTLTLTGFDKQLLGQVCADIIKLRPPDAYKGKGVRYQGQRIKLKAGKASKK